MYVAPVSDYYRLHANMLFRRGVAEVMGLSASPADFFAYSCTGKRATEQNRRQAVGGCAMSVDGWLSISRRSSTLKIKVSK